MPKILALFLMVTGLFAANAQSDKDDKCEIRRPGNVIQFERWLYSKQVAAISKSKKVYKIPVVIHIIHTGEAVGEGFNHSTERIKSQIRTLNEDFRRKKNTPGFNTHQDGEDSRIEFALAQIGPDGSPTDGIVRVDRSLVDPPTGVSDFLTLCARYSYWNPEEYLNIWCMDVGYHGIYTGKSSFPVADLKGLPMEEENVYSDGIFINAINFGQGKTNTIENLDMGRTLTHEMGHFLGLLHTFGPTGDCAYSDYCDDTPPVSSATYGCPVEKPLACDGRQAMIENYMDYSHDKCMSVFTKDQVARMHIVLENSPRRKPLITSPVINRQDVPEDQGDVNQGINIYPNPATDKLYISVAEEFWGLDVDVTFHSLLGKVVFKKTFRLTGVGLEIPVFEVGEKLLVLSVKGKGLSHRQLMMIN